MSSKSSALEEAVFNLIEALRNHEPILDWHVKLIADLVDAVRVENAGAVSIEKDLVLACLTFYSADISWMDSLDQVRFGEVQNELLRLCRK